jgi:hypothetical protein
MWTSLEGSDAKCTTRVLRLRRICSGGCLWSSLALACTPVHDLDSYAARESTGSPAAGKGATMGAGAESDASVLISEGGDSSDGTPQAGTPAGSRAGRPPPGSPEDTPNSSLLVPDAAVDAPPAPDQPARPASIVSSVPADGALGVLPDVVLVLDFGRAMDVTTVPRAIASDDIPFGGAAFAWNADESVVRITLAEPLPVAGGSEPAELGPAICYSYRVSDAALDASGQAIVAANVRFCTARRITQTLVPLSDPSLTGNFRSDGSYGDGACASGANAVCVGDSGFAANSTYRGFYTFDLKAVPDAIIALDAELRIERASINGTPFDDLGALLVEQSHFTRIDAAAFRETSAIAPVVMQQLRDGDPTLFGDVKPTLSGLESERVQLRLRFAGDSDRDGASDHIVAPFNGVTIRLNYLVF